MKTDPRGHFWYMRKISALAVLREAALQALCQGSPLHELKRRTTLYVPGDAGEHVYFLHGGRACSLRESTAHRMIELLPNGRVVTVPDAGHTVPQDNPRGFLEVLLPFLADQA